MHFTRNSAHGVPNIPHKLYLRHLGVGNISQIEVRLSCPDKAAMTTNDLSTTTGITQYGPMTGVTQSLQHSLQQTRQHPTLC